MVTLVGSLWTWLVMVLAIVVGFIVMVPVTLVTLLFDPTRLYPGLLFRRIARTVATLSWLFDFAAVEPYPAKLDGAHVVVSNHESHLDAFLISFLPYEMKWLAKDSLFKLPFIGWCMGLAGDIKVVRGKSTSVQVALRRCKTILASGMSVFLFPEGTRSSGEALLPFKDGAFRLALEAKVPVLPLAVAGTSQGLRKNSMRLYPSTARVRVGEAISVQPWLVKIADPQDPMTLQDATLELKEVVRMGISTMRAQMREELKLVQGPPSLHNRAGKSR